VTRNIILKVHTVLLLSRTKTLVIGCRFLFLNKISNSYVREHGPAPLKKNNVEYSVPEVVQPPPPLWKDLAGELILLPSLGGSGHYYWGVRI